MKCIILAGGSGERLWPVSRDLAPKSLLKLCEGKTLIQNAFEIAKTVVPEKNILTITNIRQLDETRLQLKELSSKPLIISEPMSKNTAPAVAASLIFLQGQRDEMVLILPVDFSVKDIDAFSEAIDSAKEIAKKGYVVSFGVKPSYPETGFGYIKTGESIAKGNIVNQFIEKPHKEDVEEFVKNKEYYWNSGIYLAKMSVLFNLYDKVAPSECEGFSKEMFDENNKIKYEFYENIPELSIDYALMEKIDNLAFVELDAKWEDFGSWKALYNNKKKDSKGNVIEGNVIANKVKDSFVYSSKELVAVSDIKNTIVVETEDAVLVCDKSRASDINLLVKELKKRKDASTISRKTVFRPWGFYTCLNGGKGWLSKIITVSPGHKLSLQSHNYRSEHWVVLEGKATVLLENEVHVLEKRQSIDIPLQAKHSLQNHSDEPLKILEVQKGDYISEDDIIRYEDMYGRVK